MKELIAFAVLLAGFVSVWALAYRGRKSGKPRRWRLLRHLWGMTAGSLALLILAGILAPSKGQQELEWSWLIAGALIALFLAKTAFGKGKKSVDTLATQPPVVQEDPQRDSALSFTLSWSDGESSQRDFSNLHPEPVTPITISFPYENSKGELNGRRVTVEQVGPSHFAGFCHLQGAERTFRFDRIQGPVTLEETGELISARALRDRLRGYSEWELRKTRRATAKDAPEILFTGFKKERRAELEYLASDAGMTVRTRITENLDFLCAGSNAGPAKLAAARERGIAILSETDFERLLETGELPS